MLDLATLIRAASAWEYVRERDTTNDTRKLRPPRTPQRATPPPTWTVDTSRYPSDRSVPPHNPEVAGSNPVAATTENALSEIIREGVCCMV